MTTSPATTEPTVDTAAPLHGELLRDIAAGIAAATPLWQHHVRHDPDERQPVLLLRTDVYEVWVIGWLDGQRAELHDHGKAAGAAVVVEGQLTELLLDQRGVHRQDLPTGTVRELEVGLVHEIRNERVEPATTIHVYSPPLRTMTRYDPESREPLITEILPQEEPTFAVDAAQLLRHPSVG